MDKMTKHVWHIQPFLVLKMLKKLFVGRRHIVQRPPADLCLEEVSICTVKCFITADKGRGKHTVT